MDEERIKELEGRPFFRMFPRKVDSLKKNICTFCNEPIGEFKDECSKREFQISGMCQKCQDKIFREVLKE